jgi:hypothetical protein
MLHLAGEFIVLNYSLQILLHLFYQDIKSISSKPAAFERED